METLHIQNSMIRLGQALKLANLVEDGVEARQLISEGNVSVNGQLETQRGKQLHIGDIISLDGIEVKITH
ncbi:MAG: RNA-binding S4 domain-containing protein [Micrococcaceae bacterium]